MPVEFVPVRTYFGIAWDMMSLLTNYEIEPINLFKIETDNERGTSECQKTDKVPQANRGQGSRIRNRGKGAVI